MGACFCSGACKKPPYRCGGAIEEDRWQLNLRPTVGPEVEKEVVVVIGGKRYRLVPED